MQEAGAFKAKLLASMAKAGKGLWKSLPMILGTILLVSLFYTLIPKSFYTAFFSNNVLLDPIIGSVLGSVSAGNPVTSYIFGGELLRQGVSLLAVTAFLVSWVSVGVVQLPAEASALGKKFAFWRNITAFVLSIAVALLTVFVYQLF